jgi:hypothetical protein
MLSIHANDIYREAKRAVLDAAREFDMSGLFAEVPFHMVEAYEAMDLLRSSVMECLEARICDALEPIRRHNARTYGHAWRQYVRAERVPLSQAPSRPPSGKQLADLARCFQDFVDNGCIQHALNLEDEEFECQAPKDAKVLDFVEHVLTSQCQDVVYFNLRIH